MPRSQKPAATPARPAFMQYLKAYEENPMVTKVVLKNGLTVLINEFKGMPLVALSVFVKCGYADEPDDLSGISGVLERIIFGQTTTRGKGVMIKDIRALGGVAHSEAGLDHITHDLVVPGLQWKRALEIEADAILNPVFDGEEISHAVESVSHAGQALLDLPDEGNIRRLAGAEIMLGAVGRTRTGFAKTLSGLGRDKLLSHFRTCYVPSRLILVVSGDVTSAEVLNEVVRLYAKAAPGPEKKVKEAAEVPRVFHYSEIRGHLQRPRVVFGFPAVPVSSPDYPALEVLKGIIGLGEGSAISRRLRNQKKVCLAGEAGYLAGLDAGFLSIQLESEVKDLDRCEIAALTEMELIKRQAPEDGEMARAMSLLEREYWDRLLTVSGRAHTIGEFELLGDWKKMNAHLGRLRQVKAADVVRVAEKYLRLDNCSLTEYLPAGMEARNLNAEKARGLFEQLLEPAADQEAAERERETIPAADIPKDSGQFKSSEIRFSFKTASILRGPDLFIKEDHTLPLLHLGFFYAGGKFFEKNENTGITCLMLHSMLRGSKEKDAAQLFRQLEIYGGKITPVVAADFFGFRLSVLSRNADGALGLLASIINSPKFEEEEVARQRQMLMDIVARDRNLPEIRSWQMLETALFKGHPYGLPSWGTTTTLASLSANSVKDWYKTTVEHKKPVVAMVGDTLGTSLASFFVRDFSGSRFQEVKLPDTYVGAVAASARLEDSAESESSYVLLGFQAPPLDDEDYYSTSVLASFLGGVGSRLSDLIETACGFDCDLTLRYSSMARGGMMAAGVRLPPGNEDKILKSIQDELRNLPDSVIPYRDFRSAVTRAVGQVALDQQSRFGQIETVVESVLSGKGLDALQDVPSRLQEVKQEDLPESARRLLRLDKSVTVSIRGNAPAVK